MICLSGKDLSLGYDGTVLIGNLNFEINEGDYVCVIGENGIGKSTLIKTLLKLKRPMGGKIQFFEGAKKGSIGYLPQQTQLQKDFPASVEEIVRSGFCSKMGLRPFFTKEEVKTAEWNMKKMNILDLQHRCYRELSGGQQQRALLARALCATEKMLILDEPVAGLDPVATEEMYEIIERLNREDKITIMMVTHDMENTMRYATHIFYLSGDGYFFGTKEEFFDYADKNDITVLVEPERKHKEQNAEFPEKTIPEKTISEKTIPEKTISEKTISEKTIPEKTISEKTIPEKTISEKTIPEKEDKI